MRWLCTSVCRALFHSTVMKTVMRRMYISEVHKCGSIDLRVSPWVAIPGLAPSVPAISGSLPEFSILMILRITNPKVKSSEYILFFEDQIGQMIDVMQ